MNWKHLLTYVTAASTVVACGGESDSKAPDININVEVVEVVGPEQPEDTIVNTALPITENFDAVADAQTFFGASYAALASESDSDETDNFYHSTAGVFLEDGSLDPDPNAWVTADVDPHFRMGNARFTIGQIVSVHADQSATDPRKNSTPGSLPDASTSWGELDLSSTFTVSFCVVDRSDGGNFFIYVDNNSTSSGNSIHGSSSRAVNVPQNSFVAGERASFDIEVGTPNSFIQLRADSGGWLVLDDFVIENAANPAAAQPDCAGKTTAYALSPDGEVEPPLTGTPFTGIPETGSFDVDFSVGKSNFFGTEDDSTDFLSISDDAADPFYKVTSGDSRITMTDSKLSMNNARFTIGDKGAATNDTDQPDGDLDLSTAYRITMVVSEFSSVDAADPGKFQVYVDNNTSSSGSSIHGGDSKVSEITDGDITLPYTLVLEPEIGTANSFIQVRADSRVANLTIDSISIEYIEPVVATIDWNIYDGDVTPFTADSLTLADGSTAEFGPSSASPDGADFFTANGDGTTTFDSSANTGDSLYARYVWDAPAAVVYPREFTALVRIAGNDDATDVRVIELDTHLSGGDPAAGTRVKMILRSDGSNQGVQIENIDGDLDPNAYDSADPYTGYRIYHLTVSLTDANTGTIRVYRDGSDTAIIDYTGSTRTTDSNYIRFGDGGGNPYLSDIDWIIWTEDGAYLPSELSGMLPSDIGDTTGY